MAEEKRYLAIDMKSFYASVECIRRKLDPLTANLLVADESRSEQTICLAVSPALKALGVPGRPRLFEARQKIREAELRTRSRIPYLVVPPRMADYIRVSSEIYEVYLQFVSPDDIHVYSIDECFIDGTGYLHEYRKPVYGCPDNPARAMAQHLVRQVLARTGITATVGIGTNLYLAKVAMDILAKRAPPDANGVRIAELDELSYAYTLWEHRPLTDFWMVGPGTARTLNRAGMFNMGDVAARSQVDEDWFYRKFGVNAEILLDHAWGQEPVTMRDIKSYEPDRRSVSCGQVLSRPYRYEEARLVLREMVEELCGEMVARSVVSRSFAWGVSYDARSLEEVPSYAGPLSVDFYGRVHPAHAGGTARLGDRTSRIRPVAEAILAQFDARTDHRLLFRRLRLCAQDVTQDDGCRQLSLFTDFASAQREQDLQDAVQGLRERYGPGVIFRGMDLLESATARERSGQIGGHRA